jgi:hypothetical protein
MEVGRYREWHRDQMRPGERGHGPREAGPKWERKEQRKEQRRDERREEGRHGEGHRHD